MNRITFRKISIFILIAMIALCGCKKEKSANQDNAKSIKKAEKEVSVTTTTATTTAALSGDTYNDGLRAKSDANSAKYLGYYNEVLRLMNEIRSGVGVAPLTLDMTMCQAASMRALEMDYYGIHYSSAGENIAAGYGSPASVVEGWKNSSGHYAKLLYKVFKT